jgi:ABC-type transporter Mla MlaB component
MALQFEAQVATLEGTVTVEEAETLANWLKEQVAQDSTPAVNLSACEHVHAAVLQTLLALKPALAAEPPHPYLKQVLSAALSPAQAPSASA